MKKQILFLAIALFALAGFAQATPEAPTVLWVSNCWNEIEPHDQGFIDLLAANGFTVTRWSTAAPFSQDPKNIDATTQAMANTYDLVIAGRHGGSGYDGVDTPLWNGITAPMIVTGAYNTRNSRWGMLNGGTGTSGESNITVVLGNDPVFAGVTPDENGEVEIITYTTAYANVNDAGNGILVATRATNDPRVSIARWPAGAEFYNGAGQYAGGPRMVFHCGRSGGGDGTLNLTAAGQLMFVNAAYDMSGATFDRPPSVNAGQDAIVYLSDGAQLDGTVYDPEGAVTITWSQYNGPGTATFSDTAIADPTVTFSAKGTYTLQISADDGVNPTATDTVQIHVWDTADNTLVAHWDFNGLPDPNTLTDLTGNGFDGIWYSTDDGEPNVVTGVIDTAFDGSFQDGYWEVATGNALTVTDPNLSIVRHGNTFAAWIKLPTPETAPAGATAFPVIAAFANDNRLQGRNGLVNMIGPGGEARSSRYVLDGMWHHVAGVYDGVNSKLSVYVDGILDGEGTTTPGALFVNDPELRIGTRVSDRFFYGLMDDLEIYNYPLSDAEIAALIDAGDVPLYITAGEDQIVNFKNQPVQLAGAGLVDDGKPAAATYLWELTNYPLGVDPNDIIINSPTALDTTVTFPKPPIEGGYIFTLTGDDTVTVEIDNVQITINIPTCADIIADGLTSEWDLVGGPLDGEGNPTPDCRVDILDFAAFAAEWLDCVDPQDPTCTSPY